MPTEIPQQRSENIGDADLQYLHYAGPEPAIVLMHATGFLPWLWHPIAKQLTDAHRVIAPYFCDHREAVPEKGGLAWMKLADDFACFCRRLDIASPILVGHSMGATVLALAEAVHGLGAAGMILIEPIFFPQDYYRVNARIEDHPLAVKSIKRRNRWDSAAEVKSYLKTKPLFANWEEEFLDLYIRHGMVENTPAGLELACSPPREAALFLGSLAYNPWPIIPRIPCPVLILEGEDSGNREFIDLAKAASVFRRGRLQRIAGAGHLIPMEKSADVLGIIRDFSRAVLD